MVKCDEVGNFYLVFYFEVFKSELMKVFDLFKKVLEFVEDESFK